MDLSIIIVSWNVREKLKENLEAIFSSRGGINYEVIVVDNNSQDGTADMVYKDFPRVKLVANDKNLGFARANNQAIRIAGGRYILLLNPDMKIFPDTFVDLLGWLENHPKADVTSVKLIDEAGEIVRHVRKFPNVWNQLAVILKIPHFFPSVLNGYILKKFDYSQDSIVDSVRGGFFVINSKIVDKIGLLDERFFLWFEEVDYCRRVKENGGEVWYCSAVECLDYVGQSFKQISSLKKQKYFRDSMLKYFAKWQPTWQNRLLKIFWPIGLFSAWLAGIFKLKSKAKT